jgi:Lanthionine synthetase C-like protein
MLWSPEAHEALSDEHWDAERARVAIGQIAADAEGAFDDGWRVHPLDTDSEEVVVERPRCLYFGGAGVVDALTRLERRGLVDLAGDYVPYLERSLGAGPDFPADDYERSFWCGGTGIRLVLQRVAPSADNLARLAELVAANAEDPRCELMWGSPGTIIAGRELGLDVTPSLEWLRGRRDEDGLWLQELYGRTVHWIGAGHGFAGCVLALGDPGRVSETLRRFAVWEGDLVNWPAQAEMGLEDARDGLIRIQWCHGAPGIVATIGDLLDEDLALAGAELTWRAGPLTKGPSLCHGTAGNGYALLELFARTGDELWLARARSFAMHSVAQVEAMRAAHGRGRYSLWTGDPGVALYLADCIDGAGGLPLP